MRLSRNRKPLRSIRNVSDRSLSHARGSQDLATVGQSRLRRHRQALHRSDGGQLGNHTFRQEQRPEGRRIKPSASRSYHRSMTAAVGRRSTVRRQGRDSVARSEHDGCSDHSHRPLNRRFQPPCLRSCTGGAGRRVPRAGPNSGIHHLWATNLCGTRDLVGVRAVTSLAGNPCIFGLMIIPFVDWREDA
jgi:hypothetical protein